MDRERGLLDLGNYPEILADGTGDVHFLGANVRIYLFCWRKIDGIWRKCISGSVTRPTKSIADAALAQWQTEFTGKSPTFTNVMN